VTAPLVAVTGASGFIGQAFTQRATATSRALRRLVRTPTGDPRDHVIDVGAAGVDELARALDGVAAVVHLAGRAHAGGETGHAYDARYRDANEQPTARLAQAAVVAGVGLFVLASTVKVNGESTRPGRPFRPDDEPAPQDAYARSKHAAEIALMQVTSATPTRPLVLRLPLVYGAGARGNFRRLVDAVLTGRRLPVGAIDNRRSLVGMPNLLDALDAALDAARAPTGVHFVADAQSVSTPQLVRAVAQALGVRPRILDVPIPLLKAAAAVTGQRAAFARIAGSLEVDASSFTAATRWRPRAFSIDADAVRR
jgi:UDP-glucose 4-epimerase